MPARPLEDQFERWCQHEDGWFHYEADTFARSRNSTVCFDEDTRQSDHDIRHSRIASRWKPGNHNFSPPPSTQSNPTSWGLVMAHQPAPQVDVKQSRQSQGHKQPTTSRHRRMRSNQHLILLARRRWRRKVIFLANSSLPATRHQEWHSPRAGKESRKRLSKWLTERW